MKRLFAIPHFSDPEQQRRANILVVIQIAGIVIMVLIIVTTFIFSSSDHPEVFMESVVGVVALVFSFYFLKKEKLELAGWIVVILGWLILTLDLALISGNRGVNILGQVLIVVFAGLAISGKSALIVMGISLITNLIVLYLEQSGILIATPLPADFIRYITQSSYIALVAIFISRVDSVIKKAFKETRANIDRFRALFERTNDGVFILDLNWCVLDSNPQAAELLGYPEKNMIGQKFSHWLGEHGKIDKTKYLNDILAGSDLPVFENVLQRKDGSDIAVEISLAIVPNSIGDPQHIQCIVRDITERKKYERHLVFQTLHDPLTNLPNRKYLENHFLSINNRRLDDNYLVAVLFIDIDNFKNVNDQFGHHTGDSVLKELGARLQRSVRDSDTVARIGGDEFIIVLENIHAKENVTKVAEKIIGRVSDPFQIKDQTIMITVSIGINISEKRNMAAVDLVKTSDAALYSVKEDGKNNFRFYDPNTSV